MLLFLGVNSPTWIALYALKDFIVKAGWDEEQTAAAAQVTAADIVRFRATANNFAAIGPLARHGELGWKPPSNPMKHEEATKLILNCVRAFFSSRATALDLQKKFEAKLASNASKPAACAPFTPSF